MMKVRQPQPSSGGRRAFLAENPAPTLAEIRSALSGNLCRCSGYQGIIAAVQQAADQSRTGTGAEP